MLAVVARLGVTETQPTKLWQKGLNAIRLLYGEKGVLKFVRFSSTVSLVLVIAAKCVMI